MSFDLVILEDWIQVVSEEDWADEEGITEDPADRTSGPYEQWQKRIVHPIEQRTYNVDLKNLGEHWRMRVYYKSIRDGLRFVKALFPSESDLGEAKFLADKYVHRYFQEQLAMYNAVCILHLGERYTTICECDDKDHSQHLKDEFKPLEPYDGSYVRKKMDRLPSQRVNKIMHEGLTEEDMCEWCLGNIDIEAMIKYGLCPVCRAHIPHPDAVVYGRNYDVTDEFLKWRKEKYDELNRGGEDGEEGSR